LSGLTVVFLWTVTMLRLLRRRTAGPISAFRVLVALAGLPHSTTIGALLPPPLGIAGMDRLVQPQCDPMSGRAVEAPRAM